LLRLLASRHEVQLVSFVHDADEAARVDEMRAMAQAITVLPVSRPARAAIAAVSLAGRQPLTHLLLHSRRMPGVLDRIVQQWRPEVTVAYCSGMARYAVEAPLSGIPWVLDMVDVDSEKWRELAEKPNLLRLLYRRESETLRAFERLAMARAAATTVVSERERVLLERIAPDQPSLVVSNGIDLASFAPSAPPADANEVVFCGVFNYAPNVAGAQWLAAEIWPRVRAAEPHARLSLVGMHPTRAIRDLARDPSIRVTGAVPDVRPYLWGAAVAVAPLLLARGLQNKVLEALAAGLPCVVTPAVFEGMPEIVRPACIAAGDPAAFADAIVAQIRATPDARRAFAARARLNDLSWETQLAPMLEIVEQAAAHRGRDTVRAG
jgi:sugar transferase (PEP-CTERM/EpsH1 system associated)